MRAKLDENLPVEAAELLHAAGWTCETVRDEGLGGAQDAKVGAACRAEARVLVEAASRFGGRGCLIRADISPDDQDHARRFASYVSGTFGEAVDWILNQETA